jgi:Tol biopolymer transport system component
MRADGSAVSKLTRNRDDVDPAWSPSGRFIAFGSDRDGDFGSTGCAPTAGGVRQLTRNRVPDRNADWQRLLR